MPTSPRAPAIGLPTLRDSIRASSSPCSSTSVARRRSRRARSAGATARQAGNAALAPRDGGVGLLGPGALELGDRLLGGRVQHRRAPGCSFARGTRAPRRRARSKSASSSPSSGCQSTPSGEALAGILERLDGAVLGPRRLDEPLADAAGALMVVRLDRRAVAEQRRRAGCPGSTSTSWSANTPGVCLCFSSPTTSGRCWTRSPPRATFSTCEPRQTASTGMSRSSAAVSSASSARSRSGRTPFVSGCASCAVARPGRGRSRRRRRSRRARRASPRPPPRSAARAAARPPAASTGAT